MKAISTILAATICILTAGAAQPTPRLVAGVRTAALARSESGQQVDGIAVRIEDDIIMESQVRELGKFQQLVDGKPEPRAEILKELEDQWIIRGEAKTTNFAPPSTADVDREYAAFVKQFGSEEDFQKQLQSVGLTEKDVRRLLADQLYFSRFLDYRFRPAAQVDDVQVAAYYHDEFAPAMKAKGLAVPPLDAVQDKIHEVLVQRSITEHADKWLDETREQLRIEIPGGGSGE
ncbi:MAG TPA: hypothetical protein VMJ93_08345 [Verrucomicrobiae bacterium]|nr:hypothetical protein [Verrucomicrobiae bacterium]